MSKDFSFGGKTYHIQPATDGCAGCSANTAGNGPISDLCKAFQGCINPDTILVEAGETQWPDPDYSEPAVAPLSVFIKASNPKEAMGDKKVPLHLIPATALVEESLAYAEGALKYGSANWRVAGVRVSTYVGAAIRHLEKFWNGEDRDPVSRVKHLANARACLGILIDAEACGKLTDDRPPKVDLNEMVAEAEEVLAHLKRLHAECNPKHYTELNKDEA
jgi:hypothetical protein